jgi:CBS domain containing-hemolysin-like protein
MALILLVVAVLAVALRAIAAAGSATLYAPLAPRTAANLEAAAVASGLLAAGATGLALLQSTGGMSVVAAPVLGLAPVAALLGDLLPRSLAQARRHLLPARLRGLVQRILAVGAAPLRVLETAAARLGGGARGHTVPAVGQVLSDLLRREEGADDAELSSPQVIRRIVEFRETRVHEVMVPLIHIYGMRDDAPIEEAIALVRREKLSRIPVFHERMYNIIGIVHAFDLLGVTATHEPVSRIMRPALYVPETKLAQRQLRLMQRRGQNMGVVVDEHGGTVGIVTVEDLLEEIVGEIEDEYDQREVLYDTLADGRVRVDGGMQVARLNEIFPWQLPEGEYDTIAGLVITHLGRIARVGERVRLAQVAIEVTRADARAVREVIVRPHAAE